MTFQWGFLGIITNNFMRYNQRYAHENWRKHQTRWLVIIFPKIRKASSWVYRYTSFSDKPMRMQPVNDVFMDTYNGIQNGTWKMGLAIKTLVK